MIYAGVGARKTPTEILKHMEALASYLAHEDHTLRSGAADGADSAFERGCDSISKKGQKEIYLPWENYNGSKSNFIRPGRIAGDVAEKFHPTWGKLSQGAKKLMARNAQIILGNNLQQQCDFVVCWTTEGKVTGGTGHTIRIAQHYKIPVFNFGNMKLDDMEEKIMELIQ